MKQSPHDYMDLTISCGACQGIPPLSLTSEVARLRMNRLPVPHQLIGNITSWLVSEKGPSYRYFRKLKWEKSRRIQAKQVHVN
jgi:hypothetical protein